MSSFACDKCGICCKSLKLSTLYKELDRGDGICIYLTSDNLCSIYTHRPEKCDVDKTYELHFKGIISKHEFYAINYMACEELKKNYK